MSTYSIKEIGTVLIANPQYNQQMIMYMYSDAFLKCDCGKDMMLSRRSYGSSKYTGSCLCGKEWELLNGKYRIKPTENQCGK